MRAVVAHGSGVQLPGLSLPVLSYRAIPHEARQGATIWSLRNTMFTIFTVDMEHNPLRMNVFMNHIAEVQKTSAGNILPAIGKYEGKLEHCFMCRRDDFDRFFRGTEYLKGQESVLHVASGNKMEAHLEYLADGRRESIGCMHEVCAKEAPASPGFIFRPDLGQYWVAKEGNPDNSLRESVEKFRPAMEAMYGMAAH